MSAGFDIAIVGASPLATLLAGLLQARHGRRVVQLADIEAGFRLPRGIDLSAAPITRPETWEILVESRQETLRLIAPLVERSALAGTELTIVAQSPESVVALAHLHQMVTAYGHVAERRPDATVRDAELLVIDDVVVLRHEKLLAPLLSWAGESGVVVENGAVRRIAGSGAEGFALETSAGSVSASLVVLVGPDGVRGLKALPPGLVAGHGTILLGQAGPLPPMLRLGLDSGALVHVDAQGAPLGFGHGEDEAARGAIADLLRLDDPLPLAARRRVASVSSADAAPYIGRAVADGVFFACGLGPAAGFWAPALARHIAGAGPEAEDSFFRAHAPGAERHLVRDIGAAA